MQWPTLNACLNALAFVLLILGRKAIKNGAKETHRKLMLGAFATSTTFLLSYLAYHFSQTLITKYQGTGILRTIYFAILISHSILAVFCAPAILWILYLAWKKDFSRHRRFAALVWWAWVYVSLTGVLVYFFLYGI